MSIRVVMGDLGSQAMARSDIATERVPITGEDRVRIARLAGQLSARVSAMADIATATRAGIEEALVLLGGPARNLDSAARSLAREAHRAEQYRTLDRDLMAVIEFCLPGRYEHGPSHPALFTAPSARPDGGMSDGLRLLIGVRSWSNHQIAPRRAEAKQIACELTQALDASDDPFLHSVAASIARVIGQDI